MHEESNKIMKNVLEVISSEVKARLRSTAEEIEEQEELLKRQRRIGGMEYVGILCFLIKEESMKQWVELELRRHGILEIA